ncbi:hypothetical protein SBRCBS47491_000771 [Sporothrix bragantina]|uniref:Major facilitator superfamily (MFS) profile domain-containing protein n=1 Tax=Sporothrix bragantina TaxID=671064 RepID=A0ABP0AT04_9PEZI
MAPDGQTAAELALHEQTNLLPRGKLIVVLVTLSTTLLVTFIDQNGISVALPTIAADLHGAADTISWAGTASLIGNTTFQMLYGRLSDLFGRKAVYLAAVALLAGADLGCGLSHSPAAFYVCRALAGIGGGGITNLSMIIVSDVVTLEQRGRYQGIIGAMVGLGNVSGPYLAAALIERAHDWRAFFYMLAPLAALTGVLAFFLLPPAPTARPPWRDSVRKIDYGGLLTSSSAVVFLLIPIAGGGTYFAWSSPLVIGMLVVGSVSLVAFVAVEWAWATLPMMPVGLFASPAVATMLVQNFLFGAVYQSCLYYIPLYLQNAHGYSPLRSAAVCTALVGGQTLLSILSGQYISRRQRYAEVLWAGFASWTLGCGLCLLYTRTSPPGVLVAPLLLIGIGVGCIFQPMLVALQAHVPPGRRAVITSNRNFFRCAGGAVGLAVSAAVLQATLRRDLPAGYAYIASKPYTVPDLTGLPAADRIDILEAYTAASHAVFTLLVPLIGVCLLGCVLIRDRGLTYQGGGPLAAAEVPAQDTSVLEAVSVSSPDPVTVEVDLEKGNASDSSENTEKKEDKRS